MEEQKTNKLNNERNSHLFLGFDRQVECSGTEMSGVVVLVVSGDTHYRLNSKLFAIEFKGTEFTSWYQGATQNTHCSSEEIIFKKEVHLEQAPRVFEPGTYTFPWKFDLPAGCPSSWVDEVEGQVTRFVPWAFGSGSIMPRSLFGDKSNINYTAQVRLESADHKSEDLSCFQTFSVSEGVDHSLLNKDPLEKTIRKEFLMGKAPLTLKVTLPIPFGFSGFRLPVRVDIDNPSNKKVEHIKTLFHRSLVLTSGVQHFSRRNAVFSGQVPDSSVAPSSKYHKELLVDIPLQTEPSITMGKIVKRHYELTVEVVVSRATNVEATFSVPIFRPTPASQSLLQERFSPNSMQIPAPVSSESQEETIKNGDPPEKEKDQDVEEKAEQKDWSSVTL